MCRYTPQPREITCACLLDGAGGMAGGEVASKTGYRILSQEIIAAILAETEDPSILLKNDASYTELLVRSLHRANQEVVKQSKLYPHLANMASTAICALIDGDRCYIGWVGDSRVYLWRQGKLHLVTRDHREVEDLIERGILAPEEAQCHPWAHALSRYLGQREGFAPEISMVNLKDGDKFLLCSDGLGESLTDQRIAELLNEIIPDQSADVPSRLVNEALAEGSTDNITVLWGEYRGQKSAIKSLPELTLTGAYPVAVSEAMQHSFKET